MTEPLSPAECGLRLSGPFQLEELKFAGMATWAESLDILSFATAIGMFELRPFRLPVPYRRNFPRKPSLSL